MTYEELEEALDELFPEGYSLEEDEQTGEIIIFTGLVENEDGDLQAEEELDEDFDPDFDPSDEKDDEDE